MRTGPLRMGEVSVAGSVRAAGADGLLMPGSISRAPRPSRRGGLRVRGLTAFGQGLGDGSTMRVTIVGTGNMARAIARRALAGGHHVTFVGTVVNKADELVDEFRGEGPVAADETVGGDMVVLAVPYTQAPHVVRQHADRLDGMVVVDIPNPVDLGALEPLDRAFIAPFDSAAHVIADAAPDGARVVKAFNTTFAGPLTAGAVAGRPLDVFIAGDDADAK